MPNSAKGGRISKSSVIMIRRLCLATKSNMAIDVSSSKKANRVRLFFQLAERTGLEPATSAVTGQHSNQLNYRSKISAKRKVQNAKLTPSFCTLHCALCTVSLVGADGIEPPTFAL